MAVDRSLGPYLQSDRLMARRPALDFADLEASLGYRFRDRSLLERALTHISALPGTPADGPHYERFEFLGDRVLGLAVADLLFAAFPDETEGALSRRLAALVRKETCADVAGEWGVAPYVRLGVGERQSGMRKAASLLGDICEAVIAAVYLDGGFEAARALVDRGFGGRLAAALTSKRDAKTALQEWALAQGLPVPVYEEAGRTGPDHAPVFVMAAMVEGHPSAAGTGGSKKIAEQAAAAEFLRRAGIGS